MSNILKTLAAGSASEPTDEYFNQTTLLLHGDGNQGATNFSNAGPPSYLAFSDNSSNDFPITVNGDAYGTPFSPYALSDGNWSNYFDGSGDYLDMAPGAIGTGDFTLECWVYFNSLSANQGVLDTRDNSNTNGFALTGRSTGQISMADGTSLIGTAASISANTWIHVAASRASGVLSFYVNGVRSGSTLANTTNFSNNRLRAGAIGSAGENFAGYISNARLLNSAIYSGTTITVPSAPFSDDANTTSLFCQSNRFVDNATPPSTITVNGNVAVKTLNPFDATIDGTTGSGYFDGSGDTISTPDNAAFDLGSSDFCIEFWFYPTSFPTYANILNKSNSQATYASYQIWMPSSGALVFYASSTGSSYDIFNGASIGTVKLNQFNHIAVYRSGNSWYGAVNGVVSSFGTNSGTLYNNSHPLVIGGNLDAYNAFGFISNVRIVKGDPIYGASNFTPPTSALTNVTGTSLLTCQYQGTVRNVGFIDSSPNNFPITRNGNTTQGSFSPFSADEGKWSNYFDGTGDYLSLASNADLTPASGDFCVECWIYPIAFGTYNGIFVGNAVGGFFFGKLTGGIGLRISATSDVISATAPSTNQWTHVAITRSGTDVRLFYDGVQQGSTVTNSTNFVQSATYIGTDGSGGSYWNGYISGLRFVKGSAVYTSNFTPSTTPLTAITNTELLTCQSNRFVDNSSNAFAITVNGNTSVQPFSPFAPSAAYDASVNGGSGYFDGSGDYLTTPVGEAAFGLDGDFTINYWLYLLSSAANERQISSGGYYTVGKNGNWYFGANTTNLYFQSYDGQASQLNVNASVTNNLNEWIYLSAVRSGSTLTLYKNGVSVASGTFTRNLVDGQVSGLQIGRLTTFGDTHGYIQGMEIVKGVATVPSGVPTAPSTSTANTSLLLNFTNAGILDNTGKNVLETVGNAQVDTSVVKYGTGSMKFDGTGDWLFAPPSPLFDITSGNYTVELWVNFTAVPSIGVILGFNGKGTTGSWQLLYSSGVLYWQNRGNGTNQTSYTWSPSTDTWYHLAISWDGTNCRIFIDGTIVASNTVNPYVNVTQNGMNIGGASDGYSINGLIDDLRITKGVARYTANFTPPDKAFPDQ